jgi:peptidoglycan-associated lipoprotein
MTLAFDAAHVSRVKGEQMNMRAMIYSLGAALLGLALTGCAHKPQAKSGIGLASAESDDAFNDELGACGVRVHFDYDSTEIPEKDRPGLASSAHCLKRDRAMKARIEGNADERGTEEYNLALGDRRATTVAKYLQALGAEDDQLKTVSYGEENPVCKEHKEDCWSKNRRAAVRPRHADGMSAVKGEGKEDK